MTDHNPSPHGSTDPTIDAHPKDGAFVAAVVVPAVVFAAVWAIQAPTVAAGVAGVAVGAAAGRYEVPGRIVGETPTTIRGRNPDTEASTPPAGGRPGNGDAGGVPPGSGGTDRRELFSNVTANEWVWLPDPTRTRRRPAGRRVLDPGQRDPTRHRPTAR
ncbi:hypothetical protein [Halolamina pelagica]|uniref:hypothetical protein n=1 Tax=Halolamina pelagica TaxID=699431 RepID=UPI0011875A8C|nr:hypothetical protein [Halolamina pelagica]